MVEAVLDAFVGRCQECGCTAERQLEGSMLVNLVVLDGTLYGDTFCFGCVTDDADGPSSTCRHCSAAPTRKRRPIDEGPNVRRRLAEASLLEVTGPAPSYSVQVNRSAALASPNGTEGE
jgi:hypothetical protein